MKIIEIKDLTLVLGGRRILNIPYFALEEQESISFMGPNGAGKSSLLFVMAALQEPTSGEITFFGKRKQDYSRLELQRRMAVVFQKPLLLDLSVTENIELGLKFRRFKRKDRERLVNPWLEKMEIVHLARRRARSLSGGEAQRVALAQALVLEPEVIFLDEPFANLDKEIREELMHEVSNLLRDHKIATVMVTHSRSEAVAMTASIYLIEDGEIVNKEILSTGEILNMGDLRKDR